MGADAGAAQQADRAMYGEVTTTAWVSPTLRRVQLGGPGLGSFAPTGFTDEYVMALFVPDSAPYTPPFDLDEARSLAPDLRPRARRLTVRSWDETTGTIAIDIVTHGEAGYAGRWAQQATPGSRLQMRGPSGSYRPDPDADWHLFVGDESALPAIASSLEVVAPGRRCAAILVLDDASGRIELTSPGDVEEHWLVRPTSGDPADQQVEAIAALPWVDGKVDVFVHGEAAEVRAVRRYLLAERGIDRASASISPYWRRRMDDEAWRAIKRDWLAAQEDDV
jgi:NADPH-dependent ferric siderophore reductase